MHILLAAEYLHFGGTRDYLVSLLDLYARHGARVTLVTTFLQHDPVMENFAQVRGFTIKKFPEIMSDVSSGHSPSPTVWSQRRWDLERQAFERLARVAPHLRLRVCCTRVQACVHALLVMSARSAMRWSPKVTRVGPR